MARTWPSGRWRATCRSRAVSYTHLNAEQLNITANVINLGGSDTTGVGYDTSAKFIVPDVGHRDQSLQVAVQAIKQYLQAYDQKAVTTGLTLSRKLSSVWSASAGVATSVETVVQNLETLNYTLVAVPLSVSYDSTHLLSLIHICSAASASASPGLPSASPSISIVTADS